MSQSSFFTPALLGVKESWRLAHWCLEHGANELSVRVLCAAGQGTRADAFEDAFEARELRTDRRRVPFAAAANVVATGARYCARGPLGLPEAYTSGLS